MNINMEQGTSIVSTQEYFDLLEMRKELEAGKIYVFKINTKKYNQGAVYTNETKLFMPYDEVMEETQKSFESLLGKIDELESSLNEKTDTLRKVEKELYATKQTILEEDVEATTGSRLPWYKRLFK